MNSSNSNAGDCALQQESLASRMAVYAFLSTVYFNEITLGFLQGLREQQPALEGEMGAFAASLEHADLEQTRKDLAAEYARVFLGMSRSPIAPYESVYTSDAHLLMQDARDDVLKAYRAEGIAVTNGGGLPEDHVAFEFDFMGRLCQKALEALEAGDEKEARRCLDKQREFFETHLESWLPGLCLDARKRVRTSFYQGAVELTELHMESERALLFPDAD